MADGVLLSMEEEEEAPRLITGRRGLIRWNRFPDTFPDIFIERPHHTVRGKHLAFFASFYHPESMFAQLSGTLLVNWQVIWLVLGAHRLQNASPSALPFASLLRSVAGCGFALLSYRHHGAS